MIIRTALACLPAWLALGIAAAAPPVVNLHDYVGTYTDEPGRPIELVVGEGLFAVQDEAKYQLALSGPDEFTNAGGEKISFPRDRAGKVLGFTLNGALHERQSLAVSATSAALARARPPGEDKPEDYRYRAPSDLHDGIEVGDIAESDLGPATAAAIVGGVLDGTYRDVHSVLLYQRGKLVLEEYFYGYSRDRTHQLRSATKTIVSTLAGLALDEGALSSVDAPVLPVLSYPSYLNPDPRKAKITLGHLLSMSSGLDCNDHSSTSPGRETLIDDMPDWVKATLDLPMISDPGVRGYYCSGGVAVVGRAVENAVHSYLPDFAQAKLFGPLGLARTDWSWNYTLTNANKEYAQIHLRPRDMLKVGILFAAGGRWHGRQLISSSWVATAMAEHSHVDDTGYGYFWWHPWMNVEASAGAQQIYFNAAQGNGGQKIYIVPQFDLVAVFTAGAYNSGGAPPNKIMSGIIFPALIAHRKGR